MAKEARVLTNLFAKDQRVIKDIYRKHYDMIDWNVELPRTKIEKKISDNVTLIKFE